MGTDAVQLLLYRRDAALARHRAALARSLGLMDSELAALTHLFRQGPLTPARIGQLLQLTSGGATALVQRLERAGHVTRRPHPDDRRSTLIGLTPEAARRLEAAEAGIVNGVQELVDHPDHGAAIVEFLTRIAELTEAREATVVGGEPAGDPRYRPVPSLWA